MNPAVMDPGADVLLVQGLDELVTAQRGVTGQPDLVEVAGVAGVGQRRRGRVERKALSSSS